MLMDKIINYLKDNWDLCVRENKQDKDNLIGLPYKYTVPSPEFFNEMYYWDTYFTNIGLLRIGKADLAKSNVDNMLYLVDRFGFMPNGTRTYFLNRSQPPFLSEMVKDIYEFYKDKEWLSRAYETLLKEYSFWQGKRRSDIGLNHYDAKIIDSEIKSYADLFCERIGFRPSMEDYEIVHHFLATAEGGWDLNPRWDFDAYNFAATDLNCLLYLFEKNMEYFSDILENKNAKSKWKQCSENRLNLMQNYLCDDNGIFMDYNFKTNKRSTVFSVASYYPMFVKAATPRQAELLFQNLERLEAEYGIASCEEINSDISYQWGYPNGWACLQYIMISALDNYGYRKAALRIAKKYVNTTKNIFDKTHNLWEKYNVVKGNIDVISEYGTPPMFGWSAGVYVYAEDYIRTYGKKIQ